MKISFTIQAKKDLKEIKENIQLNSPLNAKRVGEKIIDEIKKLSAHPQTGRPVIITKQNVIRQILVYKYRIFYREFNNTIQILSIYHGARLPENNSNYSAFLTKNNTIVERTIEIFAETNSNTMHYFSKN